MTDNSDLSTKEFSIRNQTYDPYRQMYVAVLSEELTTDSNVTFTAKYQATLNDKLVGFYRSSYKTSNGNIR